MIPYFVSEHGHMMYWHQEMKEIAEKNNEVCKCWSSNEPIFYFNACENQEVVIQCADRKDDCIESYELTRKEVFHQFKNYYKV
jgi:hypothetical protein